MELTNGGYYGDASAVYDYLLSDKTKLTPYLINQAFTYYLFHLMDMNKTGKVLAMMRESDASDYVKLMAGQDFEYANENPHPFTGEMKSSGLFNIAGYAAQKEAETALIPERICPERRIPLIPSIRQRQSTSICRRRGTCGLLFIMCWVSGWRNL